MNPRPLCVDLDGTLVCTDTLIESILLAVKKRPFVALLIPFWILQGKAAFKQRMSNAIDLDAATLPYREHLLDYLKQEKAAGRILVLATAANRGIADRVAQHLGIFREIHASDETINLSGEEKAKLLTQKFGEKQFDYVGNSKADLEVWRKAHRAILVDAPASLVHQASRESIAVEKVFEREPFDISSILRAMRWHQWSKNLLMFIALICAHKIFDRQLLLLNILAFLSFSLCASSGYLLNDILDVHSDRAHPHKKDRPFASGKLSIVFGAWGAIALLVAGMLCAITLPAAFLTILAIYYVSTVSYSLFLRKLLLVDVVVLAGLYTVRIFAGAQAVEVTVSPWLLGFSLFFFLSLALLKRYSELLAQRDHPGSFDTGRAYCHDDATVVASLGTASGYLSVLVFAFYLYSPEVQKLYASPGWLWLVGPLLVYWISRIWILAHRGLVDLDPILFALKDKISYIVGFLVLATMAVAAS